MGHPILILCPHLVLRLKERVGGSHLMRTSLSSFAYSKIRISYLLHIDYHALKLREGQRLSYILIVVVLSICLRYLTPTDSMPSRAMIARCPLRLWPEVNSTASFILPSTLWIQSNTKHTRRQVESTHRSRAGRVYIRSQGTDHNVHPTNAVNPLDLSTVHIDYDWPGLDSPNRRCPSTVPVSELFYHQSHYLRLFVY